MGWIGASVLLLAMLAVTPARAAEGDPEGAGDHPLIPRYAGASIIGYDHRAFDRFALPLGPQTRDAHDQIVLADSLEIEGRHTRILYAAPPDRSSLEVFENYRDALADAGFETLFECAAEECGERALLATNLLYAPDRRLRTLGPITEFAFSFPLQPYFLSARLPGPAGDIHVSLYVARENFDAFAETKNHALVLLDVIEPGTLEDRMGADSEVAAETEPATDGVAFAEQPTVAGDADAIEAALRESGRVAVYGIEFASGSATLTDASYALVHEIARVLNRNPDMGLFVVGHSDNEGGYKANLALSEERAESVVAALIERESVEKERLTAAGVGMLAPVASNDTEEGRALNRRVELVAR